MDWHRRGGYVVLAMVLFRLYWGFAGSSTARFSAFLRGPAAVRDYLGTLRERATAPAVGHNPLGGWSVIVMIAALLAMPLLGLFAVDTDGVESGPLSWLVSFKLGRRAAHWHEDVFSILQVLVALHVAAILYYAFWKKQDLVAPMVTGYRRLSRDAAAGIRLVATWRALPGLAGGDRDRGRRGALQPGGRPAVLARPECESDDRRAPPQRLPLAAHPVAARGTRRPLRDPPLPARRGHAARADRSCARCIRSASRRSSPTRTSRWPNPGAIIEYLVERHGQGRLVPAAGTEARRRYTYWLHYAEGSAMSPLLMKLVFDRIEATPMPFFARPIAREISAKVKGSFIDPNLRLHLDYLEAELARGEWFAGPEFTAADIQLSFPIELARVRAGLDEFATAPDGVPAAHPRPAGVPGCAARRRGLFAAALTASRVRRWPRPPTTASADHPRHRDGSVRSTPGSAPAVRRSRSPPCPRRPP